MYQYENGTEVTSYSTVQSTSGASAQTSFTNPSTPLTWTTLGTTLTYPTTYLAFLSPLAGVSKTFTGDNAFCYASLTAVSLGPTDYAHLIFPSFAAPDPKHDSITSAVSAYLDTIPSITAAVSPYKPGVCSHFVGPPQSSGTSTTALALPSQTSAASSSVAVVTHTSVAFLLSTGRPVISKVGSDYQIPIPNTTPQPISTGPGQGTTTTSTPPPPSLSSTPVLNIGGSTITAGPSGGFSIGGTTLTPGGTAVVGGTTISLASGGSVAVVNGQTSSLSSAAYTGPQVTNAASQLEFSGAALGIFGLLAAWL